jgi:hypothetical protein
MTRHDLYFLPTAIWVFSVNIFRYTKHLAYVRKTLYVYTLIHKIHRTGLDYTDRK